MNTLKVSVDNGNFATKSSDGMLYTSGFTQSDKEFITPEMQLLFGGKYYAIGSKRMSFQQDKTKEEDTFILTLPAIANAMKNNGINTADVILAVGLPIDIYGTQRAKFREYFLRKNIQFAFENVDYSCNIIDCRVYAQGYAALAKHYMELKQYPNLTMVDIGGYTVDILSMRNFELDKSSLNSLRLGTITLNNLIKSELQQENIILSDSLIACAIEGKLQHLETEKIAKTVNHSLNRYFRELLNSLCERGYDLKLPIVFAGGGAELLGNRLYTPELNTVAILNSFANAEGFMMILERDYA